MLLDFLFLKYGLYRMLTINLYTNKRIDLYQSAMFRFLIPSTDNQNNKQYIS